MNHSKRERPWAICGVLCVALQCFGIVGPFLLPPYLAGYLDLFLRYILPFVGLGLFVAALARHERTFWAVFGAVLTVLYVSLHFVRNP